MPIERAETLDEFRYEATCWNHATTIERLLYRALVSFARRANKERGREEVRRQRKRCNITEAKSLRAISHLVVSFELGLFRIIEVESSG